MVFSSNDQPKKAISKARNFIFSPPACARGAERGKAATKQAFNPQISQITQILKRINKNKSKSIGLHDLPIKN
jgi:hypothetical protein